MAAWNESTSFNPLSSINGGQRYNKDDGLKAEDVNRIVENMCDTVHVVSALPSVLIEGRIYFVKSTVSNMIGTLYIVVGGVATPYFADSVIVGYGKCTDVGGIAKGDTIMYAGATGGFVKIARATQAAINANPNYVLGLAMAPIAYNAFGFFMIEGTIKNMNTPTGAVEGSILYYDSASATAGAVTLTVPTPPNAYVVIGAIYTPSSGSAGVIRVHLTIEPFSDQVPHKTAAVNYTAPNRFVAGHLVGIDNALGDRYTKAAADALLLAKAGKFYATNLVTNGHFNTDVSGWGAGTGTITWDNGKLSCVSGAQYSGAYKVLTTVVGRKYYVTTDIDSTGVNNQMVYIQGISSVISYTTSSGNQKLSIVFTAISTSSTLRYDDNRSSGWTAFKVDNVVCIDLTALYGAGSEPTQVEMDKYLASKFTNSYFDGTTEWTSIQDIVASKATQIKATNLITNGNFVDTIGWYAGAGTGSVSSNIYSITGNGTAAATYVSRSYANKILGHKYYVRGSLQVTNSLCTTARIRCSGTIENFDLSVSSPTANTWYQLSGVFTANYSEVVSMVPTFIYGSTTDANGSIGQIKYLIVIDLTATFGAGKEPTVAQMNADLAYFTNSWFDGTVPFITLYTLNATKANRQQEEWIIPTLLNSWVAFSTTDQQPSYRKNGMGQVNVRGLYKNGTGVGGTYPFFTLPTSYRPSKTIWTVGISNGVAIPIVIASNGNVYAVSGSTTYIGFDICFYTD